MNLANGVASAVAVVVGLGGMFGIVMYGIGKYRQITDEERDRIIDLLRIRLDESEKRYTVQLGELNDELAIVKCEVVALRSSNADDTAAKVVEAISALWSPESFALAFVAATEGTA